MFDWWRILRAQQRVERKLLAWHAPGRPVWPMRDTSAFAREGYAQNAIAYRCVRMIAEAAASAPLKVGPKQHPLSRLLARPNPEQTGVELLEAFYGHLQVSGNAYLEAASIEASTPSELYVLRPDRMSVVPGADGWPIGWEHRCGANVRRFERDPISGEAPILHVKLFHPADDWYGLSPMEAAAFSIDRWDDGNFIRIKLFGGALASAEKDAVLSGANVFALDAGAGEWEIVQARVCALVAPNEYELRGFLRGQLGSAHAMRAPHPAGVRIVKLDQRLARVDVSAHEWGETLSFVAPPAGAPAADPRAASAIIALPHAAARSWAPAHLRARRIAGGDVEISWVRCARSGDHWGAGNPPLGAPAESYRLHILDGEIVKREVVAAASSYLYAAVDQSADFGAPPSSLRLRVAQIGADGSAGLNKELTITL